MHITDQQIETLREQGFLIVENFLNREEARAAREGFFRLFSPPYDEWVAKNRPAASANYLFPWDDSGLNHAAAHPDLINAAERVLGTKKIRMGEAHLGMKYHGEKHWAAFHIDYGNNTLGPEPDEGNLDHLAVFYCFDDVKPGMAPITMVPKGKPDSEAVEIMVPSGSICFYGMGTRHSATEWTAGPGHRPTAWIGYVRADRPWDAARTFTYKSGASISAMSRFIREASPRQREMIGFPPPGDALWTEKFLEGMAKRYAGFDVEPYRKAAKRETVSV